MQKLQSDKNSTKQVRIDAGLHQMLKIKAAKSGTSLKTLLEGYIADGLDKDNYLELKNANGKKIIDSRKE